MGSQWRIRLSRCFQGLDRPSHLSAVTVSHPMRRHLGWVLKAECEDIRQARGRGCSPWMALSGLERSEVRKWGQGTCLRVTGHERMLSGPEQPPAELTFLLLTAQRGQQTSKGVQHSTLRGVQKNSPLPWIRGAFKPQRHLPTCQMHFCHSVGTRTSCNHNYKLETGPFISSSWSKQITSLNLCKLWDD